MRADLRVSTLLRLLALAFVPSGLVRLWRAITTLPVSDPVGHFLGLVLRAGITVRGGAQWGRGPVLIPLTRRSALLVSLPSSEYFAITLPLGAFAGRESSPCDGGRDVYPLCWDFGSMEALFAARLASPFDSLGCWTVTPHCRVLGVTATTSPGAVGTIRPLTIVAIGECSAVVLVSA